MNKEALTKLLNDYRSTSFDKKKPKMARLFYKLYKKDAEYVAFRDLILMGVVFLLVAEGTIDSVKTTQNGQRELREMLAVIFDHMRPDNSDAKEPT